VLNSEINIDGTTFKNYNIINSHPLIDNGKLSNITIYDSLFQNIT